MENLKKYPDKYIIVYASSPPNVDICVCTFTDINHLEEFVNNLMDQRGKVVIHHCCEIKQEFVVVPIDVVTKWQLQVKS